MRYFLEVSYKGTRYAGFQVQTNAITIQGEIQKALSVILKAKTDLTGSSRTDAGVHARQNYFHFDTDTKLNPRIIYNLNAVLPADIMIRSLRPVAENFHARFDAIAREYSYYTTSVKDPFHTDTAWYYPYTVDVDLLNKAARILFSYSDYTTFSKRNTQVLTHNCNILTSGWMAYKNVLVYNVSANRFLRGMVRGLVGTMLLVGRKKISLADFERIIQSKDCTKANFATPAHGLFLDKVIYETSFFDVDL